MAQNEQRKTNLTFTISEIVIDPFQTTDATPTLVYAFPVAQNQGVKVVVDSLALNNTFSAVVSLEDIVSTFLRATGNVARTSVADTSGTQGGVQGNFATPQPSITITANTTNQTIEIKAIGKAATTINWNFKIEIIYTN